MQTVNFKSMFFLPVYLAIKTDEKQGRATVRSILSGSDASPRFCPAF